MKNGKMVEVEYSKQYGLQNAIHLFFTNPVSKILYEFLANELKIAVDEIDEAAQWGNRLGGHDRYSSGKPNASNSRCKSSLP